MAGKKVIVRTLDIGADKQVDYFNLDHEEIRPWDTVRSVSVWTEEISSVHSCGHFFVQAHMVTLELCIQ